MMETTSSQTQTNLAESLTPEQAAEQAGRIGAVLKGAQEEIGRVIFGQQDVVDLTLASILARGHVLLIGVPGLAKTLLVDTLGTVLDLSSTRIQCTPDLMPADILGSEILDEATSGQRHFRFVEGPVFTQILMADEINRASPRTQSALLQAMQEQTISVAGKARQLPRPFHVLATQNPIEQEGTYPLPEAQLDRFLVQINVDYPELEAERTMLIATTGAENYRPSMRLSRDDLLLAQRLVRVLPVGQNVVDAILKLVRSGRPAQSSLEEVSQHVAWGPGPRAGQALMLAARARALLQGRLAPSIDDVAALARPVLQHRMALNFAARADGINLPDVLDRMTAAALS